MDNLLTVTFEAHHAEKNHHCRYRITVGRDLLDDWTVAIRYGRTGQGCQEKGFASLEADAMRAVIRERLRRRLSATRRIGCPYRLAESSAALGFDAAAWIMVVVPEKTPPAIVERLHAELKSISEQAEFQERIVKNGQAPTVTPSVAELQSYVRSEVARWGKIVQQAGIAGSE